MACLNNCCRMCSHSRRSFVIKSWTTNLGSPSDKLYKQLLGKKASLAPLMAILTGGGTSDVARSRSYKTKTSYFFNTKTGQAKTKTAFLKTIKLLTQDLKKCSLTKKAGQLCRFCPVMPELCRYLKKKLLITGFLVKFCFIQNYDLKIWNLTLSKIRI